MNRLSEFREFMKQRQPATLSFLSENQDSFDIVDPCVFQLCFTNMFIHENPNVIFLRSGESSMRLDQVKSVELDENATMAGILIRIHCKNPMSSTGESTYTIIASQ